MALVDTPEAHRPARRARLDGDESLVLGVAARLARQLDVDPLALRAAFVVLTVAGGWGAILYAAAWATLVWRQPDPHPATTTTDEGRDGRAGVAVATVGVLLVLRSQAAGFQDLLVWPAVIVAAVVVLGWRHLSSETPRTQLYRLAGGLLLVVGGFAYLASADLPVRAMRDGGIALAVVVAGVALAFAPWVVQLTRSLAEERRERIRADERAEVATHLHDSVLQTLTLLQKRSDDPMLMAALARHQERELRQWLYGNPTSPAGGTFRQAVETMVSQVEDQHLVHVDNVTVGDGPIEDQIAMVLSAAREALVNAAKFSGERTLSLYAELRDHHVELFVRDRGRGFRLDEVADDRKGISDSIVARLGRLGGQANVRTAPGAGTEVHLRLELSA